MQLQKRKRYRQNCPCPRHEGEYGQQRYSSTHSYPRHSTARFTPEKNHRQPSHRTLSSPHKRSGCLAEKKTLFPPPRFKHLNVQPHTLPPYRQHYTNSSMQKRIDILMVVQLALWHLFLSFSGAW